MSVEDARIRLGLGGPSPERRAQLDLEFQKRQLQYKVVVLGTLPPLAKSARRARKRRQEGPFQPQQPPQPRYAPSWLRQQVYDRDAGQCQYCGEDVSYSDCNIDHVIPWPEGATSLGNLVVACQPCNKRKLKQWIPIDLRPIPGEVVEEELKRP